MDDCLLTRADFGLFDYLRARGDGGCKDVIVLLRHRRGYLYPDGAERERNWIGRGCLSERDASARYDYCFNSNIERDRR
jgi:hypothetical protein